MDETSLRVLLFQLLDMAETAKNRTEIIQQQLLNLHPKAPSVNSSRNSPPSKSQSQESLSDRESHSTSSLSSKLAKSHSEASGSSSVDGSPSKKKSSRDKSDRDRSDRRDRSKSDKGRDRHESKEKESRHRHRDKVRHAENSKEKDKSREREKSRERNREPSIKSKTSGGGEWKDYNEAKCVSPGKRTYRKDTANDSEDDDVEMNHDVKPKPLKRLPSPTLDIGMKSIKQETGSPWESDSHNAHSHQQAKKSPSSSSSQVSESSAGGNSPLKRKLKEHSEKQRSKDKEPKSERQSKEKEKPIISDPRLRRRMEKEKALLAVSQESGDTGDEPIKPSEWKDYRARQQAVLRRSYRKHTGIDMKDDGSQESHDVVTVCNVKTEGNGGDVDLRFEPPFDVDLRTETDGSGPEPPAKKSRPGSHSTFVEYYAFLNTLKFYSTIRRKLLIFITIYDTRQDCTQCSSLIFIKRVRVRVKFDNFESSQENDKYNLKTDTQELWWLIVGHLCQPVISIITLSESSNHGSKNRYLPNFCVSTQSS